MDNTIRLTWDKARINALSRLTGKQPAIRIWDENRSLRSIARLTQKTLRKRFGLSREQAMSMKTCFQMAQLFLEEHRQNGLPKLNNSEAVADMFKDEFTHCGEDEAYIVFVDCSYNFLTSFNTCTRKPLTNFAQRFRSKVKESEAAGGLVVSNHPNRTSTPLAQDVGFARFVIRQCRENGISFIDHVVLGQSPGDSKPNHSSLTDLGLL